ncbi:hypothetical protein DEU37_1567 [Microbacterium sp. AG790]|uniref:DUF6049 family protein n=1 Tax=Microbacterium sp. AG790 TaxID=2183995 RepID=UPI000EB2ECE0|nr:DUF6049 family protein [Microbacterium sp. AG790]RKS90242.1 hypothetical protein DEU37_1567 [Microbacterium sp. AG790]
MTVSFPAAARRSPDGVRDRRRALSGTALRSLRAAAAIAASVGIALAIVAAPAPAPADAATGAPDAGSLSVAVAPAGNGVVTTTVVSVAVAVSNTGDAAAASGTVSIALSRSPLTTSAELTAWLDARTPADTAVASVPVTAVAARGTATATAAVDLGALGALAPGVYPLSAAYSSSSTGAQPLVAHSVLTVPDAASAGSGVGVVVPITAPPTTTGLLTADDLKALTADDGALRTQLNAVTGTPAILAVDPAIPAAIRVLGSAAPASARQWLADLLALPNSRFALQFGDADLATQVAAGLPSPLSVSSLDPFMSARNFTSTAAAAGAGASPTATPAPDGRTLPTLAQLLDIGAARADVFWPATGSATAAVVSALKSAAPSTDAADPAPITLVGTDALTGAVGARADAAGAGILAYDDGASSALRTASLASDPVHQGAGLAAASAYASLATRGAAASAPLLVVVDRATGRSATGLRAAITAASSLAGRTPWDLDALLAAPAASVSVTGGTADDPTRVDALRDLLDQETRVAAFATVLADPTLLTAPDRAEILQLMGNVWRAAPDQFATALSEHRDATTTTLGSVAIVPPSDITLLASSAPLTFSVRNDLPWPVTLTLSATPNDPRLIVQKSADVSAGAAQSTRVQVPVQARVGSGESTLDLQLRSSAGVEIGPRVRVAISVRAEWESVGIVVMSVLIGVMLVLGIVRTARKMRRRRITAATAAHNPQTEDVDG